MYFDLDNNFYCGKQYNDIEEIGDPIMMPVKTFILVITSE